MGTHQHQPIDARAHLGVLCDVSTWHPQAHDAKWKLFGDLDDGEHIGKGRVLARHDFTESLVRSVLSTPLIEEGHHIPL
jgi:hypothetical protein